MSAPASSSAAGTAVVLGLLAVVVLGIHWPLGRADFSFDDKHYVQVNASIRSLPAAWQSFGEPFPSHRPELRLYRPLTNVSYALDFARSGESARGYHVSNVWIYVASVWLVFALGRRLVSGTGFAFALALSFAVHPVHCEAVDSVTGRSELLAFFFACASLVGFLRALAHSQRGAGGRGVALWLAASTLCYALACFSKETGVVTPAVLAAFGLAFDRHAGSLRAQLARLARWLAPHAAVLGLYLVARIYVLGGFAAPGILDGQSLLFRLHALGMASFQYARLLVFPRVLEVDYYWGRRFGAPRETWLEGALGLLALAAALLALLWLLRRVLALRERPQGDESARSVRLAFCGLATLGIFLFPVSHLLPVGALMAERFLYAPSLGFCLLAVALARAALLRFLPERVLRTRAAVGALVLVCLLGAVRSHQRAREWRDEVALWLAADRHLPGDQRVLVNLAFAYQLQRKFGDARAAVQRARAVPVPNPQLAHALDLLERQLDLQQGR